MGWLLPGNNRKFRHSLKPAQFTGSSPYGGLEDGKKELHAGLANRDGSVRVRLYSVLSRGPLTNNSRYLPGARHISAIIFTTSLEGRDWLSFYRLVQATPIGPVVRWSPKLSKIKVNVFFRSSGSCLDRHNAFPLFLVPLWHHSETSAGVSPCPQNHNDFGAL